MTGREKWKHQKNKHAKMSNRGLEELQMKRLFELGNQYVRESDWKDLALVKFCLCAMGIMIGTQVPKNTKKQSLQVAAGSIYASDF